MTMSRVPEVCARRWSQIQKMYYRNPIHRLKLGIIEPWPECQSFIFLTHLFHIYFTLFSHFVAYVCFLTLNTTTIFQPNWYGILGPASADKSKGILYIPNSRHLAIRVRVPQEFTHTIYTYLVDHLYKPFVIQCMQQRTHYIVRRLRRVTAAPSFV